MKPALQRRIQRYGWDKASEFYETYWLDQLSPAHTQLLDLVQATSGEQVLDIASGSGQMSLPLAKMVETNGSVIATDLSDKMVLAGTQKVARHNLSNLTFEQMGAESLDFEDNSFDLVICSLGLMYVPDPLTAFKEIFRVLKPGGRVGITVWGKRENCGWASVFEIVDKRVVTEVCPMFFQLGNPKAIEMVMELAGFDTIQIETKKTILEYPDAKSACGAAFEGGPVALAYFKFDETTQLEAQAEYIASIEQYQSDTGYKVPGEFLFANGRKQNVQLNDR